jgi:hypothetical protein
LWRKSIQFSVRQLAVKKCRARTNALAPVGSNNAQCHDVQLGRAVELSVGSTPQTNAIGFARNVQKSPAFLGGMLLHQPAPVVVTLQEKT